MLVHQLRFPTAWLAYFGLVNDGLTGGFAWEYAPVSSAMGCERGVGGAG